MPKTVFCITKWTKHITDNGKAKFTMIEPAGDMVHKFRLKDDDNIIYAYGFSNSDSSFAPMDAYQDSYGVTSIEYYDKDKKEWQVL